MSAVAPARGARAAPRSAALLALLLPLMAAALLAPALWNGFPLIFADTGGYLERPFERTLEIGRSALYGAFLAAGIATDFWLNVIAQAALCVWLLLLTLRVHGLGGRPMLALALVLALAVLTGLPWYVSQLIPDVFVGASVLALYLLAYRARDLGSAERIALVGSIAFGIASHMSVLALSMALVVALLALRPLLPRWPGERPRLLWPASAAGAGVTLALLSNLVIAGQFTFTPGGASFFFGRLVQDGIIARYLDDTCPDPAVELCAYRHQMPDTADGWLWWFNSPFYKLGGHFAVEAEERRIIAETFRRYPLQHLTTAIGTALEQLTRFKTGEGMHPHDNEFAVRSLERLAPQSMERFHRAAQQRDLFDFTWINRVHVPIGAIAMLLLPVLVGLGATARIAPPAASLALFVLLALLANAAISGIFSNPVDRYQSRLIWLAPLAVFIAVRTAPRPAPVRGAARSA